MSDVEIRVLHRLSEIIQDVKKGLDPDVLAYWYRVIEEEAKRICPEELREKIQIRQHPILWMKFELKISKRAIPYLIEAIESNLNMMPFATRLYFQKLEEIIMKEFEKVNIN
jgi:hypothetical protein